MSDIRRRTLLIQHSQRLRSPLPALMEMDSPPGPPVPPKDYQSSIDGSRPPTATSGSKRKRQSLSQNDIAYDFRHGRLQVQDPDGNTPNKRSRSARGAASVDEASTDDTPMQSRYLRRKKGIHNLSNLNLRHAASLGNMPHRQTSPARESKFQEGSLTDKPSEKPPSVFTKFQRTDSGNLMHVDQLMEDYHEVSPMPAESVEATLEYERATRDQRVAAITAARQKKEENSGVFRFGKSWASSFNPFTMWNKIWNEQKEELARKDREEAERKARQKAEAEAKYAQLKSEGQFGLKPVALHTPHDSVITLDGDSADKEHHRTISYGSIARTSYDDMVSQDGGEMSESAVKQLRSSKSRLHLRRPSLQSLRGGLRRIGSVSNLVSGTNRESSSSMSPTKTDLDGSTLRKSQSRFDLKKQNRLSKRVSDLELKLQKARNELDEALTQASPMPHLGNKHQRFTPRSTLRKSKFIPGALPTLPSERILFPEQLGLRSEEGDRSTQRQPRKALDLSTAFDDIDGDGDEDMETPREKPQSAHAFPESSKPMSDLEDSEDPLNSPNKTTDNITEPTSDLAKTISMDPGVVAVTEGAVGPKKRASHADLDTKLKALDDNIKMAKKSKSKKRASHPSSQDRPYRPSEDPEEDDDPESDTAAKPKKKRKSTGMAEAIPAGKRGKQKSPRGNKKSPRGKVSVKPTADKFSPDISDGDDEVNGASSDQTKQDATMADAETNEEGPTKVTSVRSSLNSEEQLEPVYEEEEETTTTTTTVPVKDVPSKPTAKATPARYMHNAVRSRSASPHKRSGPVQAGSEEKILTRAANAAQLKRTTRSRSPPPAGGYRKKVSIVQDVVKMVPGEGDIPSLPKGATGSFESLPDANVEIEVVSKKGNRGSRDENFEWPDDVF